MKPAGGRIRSGATSIANVTGGPVGEGTVQTGNTIFTIFMDFTDAKQISGQQVTFHFS